MTFVKSLDIKIVCLLFLALITDSQKLPIPSMTPKPTGPHDIGERGEKQPTTTLSPAEQAKKKYEEYMQKTTKKSRVTRTTQIQISFDENCDYLAYYCLRAYKTGKLCARTIYYTYHVFKNYCLMDYVNCMERYDVWQVVHMGECYNMSIPEDIEYLHYPYDDDHFLDQYYAVEDTSEI